MPEGAVIRKGRFGEEIPYATEKLRVDEVRRSLEALIAATRNDKTVAEAISRAFGVPITAEQQEENVEAKTIVTEVQALGSCRPIEGLSP